MNILQYPNEVLHKKSEKVEIFDKKLKKLVKDMYETMYKYNGIGLAGVQVGILKRVIVIDINHIDFQFKSEIINPRIISFSSKQTIMNEGCLSVVGNNYDVLRPEEVVVEYQKLDGQVYKIEAKGLLAKCLQHEIDHLEGITIADKGVLNNAD